MNLTTVIIIFAQCDPPRKLWQPELPGNCKIEEVNGVMGYVCGGETLVKKAITKERSQLKFLD